MLYEKDKAHRITLRLNDPQFEYVKKTADVLGVSPSEFLRMVVNAAMFGQKVSDDAAAEVFGEGKDNRRENETAVQHNIV